MFDVCKRGLHCTLKKCTRGFSLIELMVVLAIAAILAAIAAPNLSRWVDSSRAKAVRQQLYGVASEARFIALKQSQTITLCHLERGECQAEFGLPVSLFTDTNRNAELDSGEKIVRVLEIELPQKTSLSWNHFGYMRFYPDGGTGALTGSLSYCDQSDSENDFRIVVARTGRLRIDESEAGC